MPYSKTVVGITGAGLRLVLSLFIFQLLSYPALALDPHKTLNQYSHEKRTNQNGLPGEAVNEIVQTPDGYLWLRTSSGLVRFDGVRFVRIEPGIGNRIGNEPLHEAIRAICSSAGGDLLIRSDTRTLIYRNNTFSNYAPPSPLPDGATLKIFEMKGKQVWIGADNFVYQIRNDAIGQTLGNTGWATAFLEDHFGNLWIATASGLFRYSKGVFTQYSTEFHQAIIESTGQVSRLRPGRHPIKGRVTALAEDSHGNLWVGTRDGLYRMVKGDILAGSPIRQLKGQHISGIKEDKDGNLWVGTDASGIFILTNGANGKWSSMNAADGLTDDTVLSLFEDREGSIWVGTKSGLDRFRNSKIIPFTTKEGLAHNNAVSIIEARDGSLYIFSAGGGLTRIKDGKSTVFTTRDGLASNYGGALFESRDGSIWIGTDRGLCRLKDNKITTYQAQGRLSQFNTSTITEDDESLIVCTSELRVFRFRDGNLSDYTIDGEPNPFAGKYVFTITRDQSGDLWFGTVEGLYRISRGKPPGGRLVDYPITSIYDDQQGSLWLSGRMPGLARVRISDGRTTRYTKSEGLFDNEIQRALSDKDGNLWLSTPRGIFTVSRQDLDDYAEGRSKTVRSTSYNIADGMKTIDCSSHIQPSGWRGRDGRLWFTTRKGIVLVDLKNLTRNEITPPVAIEEVTVEGESFPTDNFTELEPGKQRFEFHYNGLSLLIPERVRFKYQLEGYDRDWIDAGTRRVAYYTNLAPGKYRFRVIASNNDGVWNDEGAAYEFSLTPHFYQRTWFYLSCAALVSLMGLGIHQLIVGQMKARFMAVLAERKRIASELHDTVEQGLSMILLHLESGAARMSESPQAARQHLELARQMVKHSLIETRHSVLELYSQELDNRDLVSALAQLVEKLTTGTSIETDVRVNGVSRKLPAVAGHHLLLLCQEAITNALKHAHARRVTVALNFEPQRVEVSVQDDGCGFDPDSPLHLSGGHFGLVGMRERIKKLGGRLTLNSRPGTGTEVVIMVPIS